MTPAEHSEQVNLPSSIITLSQVNDIRTCDDFHQQMMRSVIALHQAGQNVSPTETAPPSFPETVPGDIATGDIILDAAPFEAGDVTCLQILLSAAKLTERFGGKLHVLHANPAFMALLSRCGIVPQTCGLHFPQERGFS